MAFAAEFAEILLHFLDSPILAILGYLEPIVDAISFRIIGLFTCVQDLLLGMVFISGGNKVQEELLRFGVNANDNKALKSLLRFT